MSSHSVRLSKTLREIEAFKEALKMREIKDEYHEGLYNGVELVLSLLTNKKPEYIKKKCLKELETNT